MLMVKVISSSSFSHLRPKSPLQYYKRNTMLYMHRASGRVVLVRCQTLNAQNLARVSNEYYLYLCVFLCVFIATSQCPRSICICIYTF